MRESNNHSFTVMKVTHVKVLSTVSQALCEVLGYSGVHSKTPPLECTQREWRVETCLMAVNDVSGRKRKPLRGCSGGVRLFRQGGLGRPL